MLIIMTRHVNNKTIIYKNLMQSVDNLLNVCNFTLRLKPTIDMTIPLSRELWGIFILILLMLSGEFEVNFDPCELRLPKDTFHLK